MKSDKTAKPSPALDETPQAKTEDDVGFGVKGPEDEIISLTPAETHDAETLAELITDRADSERILFQFFEAIPAERKERIHNHALTILKAYDELRQLPQTRIQ